MDILKLDQLDLKNKRVLIRQDLNVPVVEGKITSTARIEASIPTIEYARKAGAKVLLMSHMGRPKEGQPEPGASLLPVASYLTDKLDLPVSLVDNYLDGTLEIESGQVVLLENVRFNPGEKANDDDLAMAYAKLCDIFVMDAFGTAHRAQASTYGVGMFAPISCAGPLLSRELDALDIALANPARPMVAIVGGAKVSTKLTVLDSLSKKVDKLIPGGGIANTFIAAAGYSVGSSLYEPDLVDEAKNLIDQSAKQGGEFPVPVDVVVGQSFSADSEATVKSVADVSEQDLILDIGPRTIEKYCEILQSAGTIVWNGPVGVFEFDRFANGSREIGDAIAKSKGYSIAGGGDTLAAIEKFNLSKDISYISTGGGAFLEFLEGRELPAVAMLKSRNSHKNSGP